MGYRSMADAVLPDPVAWRSIDESPIPASAATQRAPRREFPGLSLIRNAPWWLISAGLHAVLILAAALVYVERLVEVDEGAVEVLITARAAGPVAEIERPRDVFERKGIPKDDAAAPSDEPAIFFPEAKESDHNESADGEDYHQMKGESKNFLSYTPGEAGGFRG